MYTAYCSIVLYAVPKMPSTKPKKKAVRTFKSQKRTELKKIFLYIPIKYF